SVDNNTRTSWPPCLRPFLVRPTILQHDPGLAASPPVRYTLEVARSEIALPCLLGRPLRAYPFSRSSPNRRPPSLTVAVAQIGRHPSERPHPIPNPGRPDRRPAAPLHRPDPLVLRAGLGRCGPRGSRSAHADPLRHASLQVCREQRSGEGQTYSWSS